MSIEPKEFELTNQAGVTKTFILHKFPAVAGREIVAKYPISIMPKIGDYQVSEEIMLKLMGYVGVQTDAGTIQMLTTRALVDNHATDWETLAKLEIAMMEYNCSFFGRVASSDFFESIVKKVVPLIIPMLTGSSDASSPTEKPRSTN